MKKKIIAMLLCLCLAIIPFSACKKQGSTTGSTTYRTLYSSEVTTLNYLTTGSTDEIAFAANTVDCLIEFDQYGNIVPGLAESWKTSDDGLTWTFTIRKGVKWVDNNAKEVADVTANDFVSAAKYALDAKNDSSTEYMYEGIIKNAAEYYESTIEPEDGKKKPEPVDFETVGVKATDDYTLVYTLEKPTPYFLTVLTYGCYLPVYGPYLEEKGESFATDNTTMLYCGAFYISTFAPQSSHVLTKNPTYWDKDKVYIEKIEKTYNQQAGTLAPDMFKRGEIDYATISADILNEWKSNPDTKDLVSSSRLDNSYSYFYAFNFDPNFDAEYEPENWKKAVNNENFRKAMMAAFDRVKALSVSHPDDAEKFINNTITPADFCAVNGVDFTQLDAVKSITEGDSFNKDKALEYKELAKAELAKAGATFPVKVLMPYNPSSTNWDKECTVAKQQIEEVLGKDFVDITVEAGPSSGFLSSVRRAGKYAFMSCNWGCDYADPETWAEPFSDSSNYNFIYKSEDPATKKIVDEYYAKVAAAKAEYQDIQKRYDLFAQAEKILIDHAMVVPYSVTGGDNCATKLNTFEAQYAPYGITKEKYKGQHVQDKAMSQADYDKAYEEWLKARENSKSK